MDLRIFYGSVHFSSMFSLFFHHKTMICHILEEPSMWPNALSCLAARLGITDFVGLDATSWNLVISAVAAASEWQKALWLFSGWAWFRIE
jgi:hypothetical protein